jgi:hypothetical protein
VEPWREDLLQAGTAEATGAGLALAGVEAALTLDFAAFFLRFK